MKTIIFKIFYKTIQKVFKVFTILFQIKANHKTRAFAETRIIAGVRIFFETEIFSIMKTFVKMRTFTDTKIIIGVKIFIETHIFTKTKIFTTTKTLFKTTPFVNTKTTTSSSFFSVNIGYCVTNYCAFAISANKNAYITYDNICFNPFFITGSPYCKGTRCLLPLLTF